MDHFGDTELLEVFHTKVVHDLIRFKWYRYGVKVHKSAAFVHMIYVITFLIYLDYQYLKREDDFHLPILLIMCVCNNTAFLYDTRQLIKQGSLYFMDAWNFYDQLYIWSGYLNLYL